jgi:CRP-like cAMP-binding protein
MATSNITTIQSVQERCEMLSSTQWVSDMSWPEMQTLAAYLKAIKTPKGQVICHEGDYEPFLCIMVDGKVNVVKENNKKRQTVIAILNKGKTFGEMSIFDGEPRSASVVAAENSTLLVLNREGFDRLIHEKPGLAAKLLLKLGRMISQRLRVVSGKLVDYM